MSIILERKKFTKYGYHLFNGKECYAFNNKAESDRQGKLFFSYPQISEFLNSYLFLSSRKKIMSEPLVKAKPDLSADLLTRTFAWDLIFINTTSNLSYTSNASSQQIFDA